MYLLLLKCIYQFLTIVISLVFQFFHKPFIYAIYRLFKRIYIHILFCSKGNAVFLFPAVHNLCISGTVDVTLILNSFLTTLINNSLLPFLVTCLAAFLLTAFCQMFRLWIFHGASFWRLLAVALGQSVLSLPLAIPYYYISRAFHRRRALR